MSASFDVVDEKIAETEFFLGRMVEAGSDGFAFRCYLSAFLSAARSTTWALEKFAQLPGFETWYASHRERVGADPLAPFMIAVRNEHVHEGLSPLSGGSMYQGRISYHFRDVKRTKAMPSDVVAACRAHFIAQLEIVYDCYIALGPHIDPQQYYTKEHFASLGKGIDHAECEVNGWIMESLVEAGWDEDERWHELRGRVGACQINHLFHGYLGKVSPQPLVPEHIADTDFTHEDRGWLYTPPGFSSISEYIASLGRQAPTDE